MPDSAQTKSVISVPDFCIYYILLRRYFEIMDIGRPSYLLNNGSSRPECAICMNQADEVVLPCAHSMCSACAVKWVEVHGNCPFCRHHYEDGKRMEKDQWQVGRIDLRSCLLLSSKIQISQQGSFRNGRRVR